MQRILVASRDVGVGETLKACFSDVVKFTQAGERRALDSALGTAQFDLVFVDMDFMGHSGVPGNGEHRVLLQRLWTNNPHMVTVLLVGQERVRDAVKVVKAGADNYLTKPIDPDKLFSVIAEWTGRTVGRMESSSPAPDETEQTGDLKIPGLDTALGLARANNNARLFRKLLTTFARDFAEPGKGIREMQAHNAEEARRTAHSIKGVGANIGATRLSSLAADLETCIAEERTITDDLWQDFSDSLEELLTGIAHADLQDKKVEKSTEQATADPAKCLRTVKTITTLLDEDLDRARETLETILPSLVSLMGQEQCETLAAHMEDFAIDEAEELLAEMARELEAL